MNTYIYRHYLDAVLIYGGYSLACTADMFMLDLNTGIFSTVPTTEAPQPAAGRC